jgi:oligosaccharide repeat unit polymerase
MTCTSATAFLALLTIVNFFAGKRRVLYPPLIYSFVWFMDTTIFGLSPIEVNEVHAITWWVIALGALVFSAGGWLTSLLPRSVYEIRIRELSHPTVSSLGRTLLILLCVLGTPLFLHDVLQRGGSGSSSGLLVNARQASLDATVATESSLARDPIMTYLPVFSIWVATLCLIESRDKRFWLASTASLICCVLATGRTLILLLFSALIAVHMLKARRDTFTGFLRTAAIPGALFAALFVDMIFLAKDTTGFRGNIGAILSNYTIAYLVAPIASLDYVLTHPAAYAHAPHHTFGFLSKLLNATGYSLKVASKFGEYLFVPYPNNVYTIYKFYFTDFGLIGMFASILTIGSAQTVAYRRALAGGRVSLFLSALLVFPAILSIFDDSYSQFVLLIMSFALALFYFGWLNRLRSGIRMPRFHLGLRFANRSNS